MIYLLQELHTAGVALLIFVCFAASLISFYSGFGLGTLLLPVFALWFPVNEAIIMTAIVHFINNLFKLMLIRKNIDPMILLRFGVPAIVGALIGSLILNFLSRWPINFPAKILHMQVMMSPVKLLIGLLIIVFGAMEFIDFGKRAWSLKSMTIGGVLSGFFGGLSGHQGALRSAFLLRYQLTKEIFIATGIGIACLVDTARIIVYSPQIFNGSMQSKVVYIMLGIVAAFAGAWFGNRYLKKLDLKWIKFITALGVIAIGIFIAIGLI